MVDILTQGAGTAVTTISPPPRRIETEQEALIRALLNERRGYEDRGLADRVKLIDAELARVGYEAK
jgi:hypothetical protein